MEITNQPGLQVESATRGEHRADALHELGGDENIILRMESLQVEHQEQKFFRNGTQRSSKPWKETLVMRQSIKISNSKSQFENIQDSEEMPSIRL